MWEPDIMSKSLNFSSEKITFEDYNTMSFPDCQDATRLMMMMIQPDLFYPYSSLSQTQTQTQIPCSPSSSSSSSSQLGPILADGSDPLDFLSAGSTIQDNYYMTMTSTAPTTILSLGNSFLGKIDPPAEALEVTPSSRNFILTYCILFIIGAVGNLSVFATVSQELWRKCHRSRIKVLILHLSIADLLVIFFVIPVEVFWRLTVVWYGGELLCKICQFCRAFGLYLSSNVIICISLDRFYVIISPLKVIGGMRRVKNMLALAWLCAIVLATPQSVIFSLQSHPLYNNYELCVPFHYFDSVEDDILYNLLGVSAMYFAPLTVILFTYVGVLIKVTRRSRQHQNISEFQRRILQQRFALVGGSVAGGGLVTSASNTTSFANNNFNNGPDLMITSRILLKKTFARRNHRGGPIANGSTGSGNVGSASPSTNGPGLTASTHRRGSQFLRMSSTAHNITRSRRHAFFLTLTIITTFVICWTPFVTMTLWCMFDWETAKMVDSRVQQAFFIMAISNSCVNPILYGNICCRRRPTPTIASDEQRSGNRRETCDTGQF